MNEPYFDLEKLKVGDRLWDAKYGWGMVEEVRKTGKMKNDIGTRPIKVRFSGADSTTWFTTGGRTLPCYNQTLFYDEIKFVPPPRPKRLVKKLLEGWVNIYPDSIGPYIYETKMEMDSVASSHRIACVHIEQPYEVEE